MNIVNTKSLAHLWKRSQTWALLICQSCRDQSTCNVTNWILEPQIVPPITLIALTVPATITKCSFPWFHLTQPGTNCYYTSKRLRNWDGRRQIPAHTVLCITRGGGGGGLSYLHLSRHWYYNHTFPGSLFEMFLREAWSLNSLWTLKINCLQWSKTTGRHWFPLKFKAVPLKAPDFKHCWFSDIS